MKSGEGSARNRITQIGIVLIYLAFLGLAGLTVFRAYHQQVLYTLGEANRPYYVMWFLLACALFLSFDRPQAIKIWYVIVVAFALFVIFGDMRFARIDEGCHLDYICYVAREHRLPDMYQEVDRILLKETGVINPLYPDFRYEAVQTPLYYILMSVPAMLIGNMRWILYFARLAGLCMWGASLLVCRRTLQMLRDAGLLKNYPLAILMLNLFGVSPGVLIRCSFASNEPLTILLTVLLLHTTMTLLAKGYSGKRAAAGLAEAVALFYTKSTGVFVIGGMLLVLLYYRKFLAFFGSAAAYAASAVPWFIRNFRLYGTATGMNEHIRIVIDRINPERKRYNLIYETFTIFERKYFIPAEVDTFTSFTENINKALSVFLILMLGFFVVRELKRMFGYLRGGWHFSYRADEKRNVSLMVCAALVFANIVMLALSTRGTMLNTLIGRYLYFLILPMSILFSDWTGRHRLKRCAMAGAAIVLAVLWLDTMVYYTSHVCSQHWNMTEEKTG